MTATLDDRAADTLDTPVVRATERTDPNANRLTCSLIVTHQCNLNCTYCYETFKSNKSMPIQIAKDVITRGFATSEGYEGVVIDFMGGEPLLQFELIREISEWIWSNSWPQPYILSITTNGTLLTDAMKGWFRKHAQLFSVGLSLDGTPAMHLMNRGCIPDSDIDLDFFRLTWPDQGVKMTVSQETLPTLAEGIIYVQERGFVVHANLGYGIPWCHPHVAMYAEQLRILGEYYLQHPEVTPVTLLDRPIEIVLNEHRSIKKYCGTGTHMRIFDIDGTLYPCHMFTPLVLSRSQAKEVCSLDFNVAERLVDPMCVSCGVAGFCPTCYGINYKFRRNPALRDPMLCQMFKVQILECCRYQVGLLQRKRGEFDLADCRKAKSILKLCAELTV